MSERQLPELRSRLRIDDSDLDRAGKNVDRFQTKLSKPVKPSLDASGLEKFGSVLERNSQDLQKFGRSATRDLTLPIIAAAGASAKLSLDFDKTFQRMVSLAGVAADEVDGLKESVKQLAVETGKSPQDLAEGLEVIRSAGITGAQALDVLDKAAKGSAIGLGTTREIADAVTSVLNSYGSSTITAGRATDILAASVQAAKVEAADMAPQFGRLLPLANTLGIGFEQVGGALAYLTRGSGDAALAATQLSGIFAKLLNPGQQARQILADTGLSADELSKTLKEKGLIASLNLLNDSLGGDPQKLSQYFQDIQAIQGVYGLIGSDSGKAAASTIADVNDSVGKGAAAFKAYQNTDTFKLQKSLAELKVAMIDLGHTLVPVLTDLAKAGSNIAKVFSALPGPVQAGLLAIVALVGPVSSGLGKIGANLDRLQTIGKKTGDGLSDVGTAGSSMGDKLSKAATLVGAAVGAFSVALAGFDAIAGHFDDTKGKVDGLALSFEILGKKGNVTGSLAEAFGPGLEKLNADIGKLTTDGGDAIQKLLTTGGGTFEARGAKSAVQALDDELAAFAESSPENAATAAAAYAKIAALLIAQGVSATQVSQLFSRYLDVVDESELRNSELGPAIDGTTTAIDANSDGLDDNTGAQITNNEAHKSAIDLMVEQINTLTAFESANASAVDALKAYNDNQETAAGRGKEIEDLRKDAARQELEDNKSIASARKDAAQAAADVADARKAEADAAGGVADALKAEAEAIKHESDLKKKAADLQDDLTAAWAKGEKQLESLKRTAEGDQLSVRDAERAVQAAQDAVSGFGSNGPVQDDPNTRVNERQAALDDLRRAELDLADAKDTAAQSAQDQADADKKGVAGTPAVTDALTAIKDNDEAVAAAHQDVIDKGDAVQAANDRLAQSHADVTTALGKEAEAQAAVATAAEESRAHQAEAIDKIKTKQDEAIAKADELRIAALTAIGDYIAKAKDASLPTDAIEAGIKHLIETTFPAFKIEVEKLFGLTGFAPTGSEADQGLYALGDKTSDKGKAAKGSKQSIDKPGVTVPESTVPASAGLPQTYDSLPEGFYWFYDVEAQGWYGAKVPNRNADVALADITSRPPTGEKLPDGYYWYFDSKAGTWYSAKIPEKTTDVPLAEGAPVKKPASVLPASQLNLVYPQDGFYRPNGDIISPAEYVATVAAARKRKAEERLNNVADQPAPPSVIGGFTNTGNQRPSVRPVARGSKDLTGTTPTELAEAIVKAGKTGEGGKTVKVEAGAITVTIPVTGSMSDRQQQELKKTIRGEIDEALEKVAS